MHIHGAVLDLAPPGDTELLVRIEAAGLCHSDLSVVDGNRVRPVPMLLGHETAGIVERVGDAGDIAVGQRVVMTPAALWRLQRMRHRRSRARASPGVRPTARARCWPAGRA
jgi:threonine dehydrogenase-like Zn-dependent dehydrogenase